MAAAKKVSVDSAIVAVLSELNGIFILNEEQRHSAFLSEHHCSTLPLTGFD